MYPPIYSVVNIPSVQAVLKTGNGPLRFYLFGMAPQNVEKPYAVWQTAYGSPENYISQNPDMDYFGVQVDVYASEIQGPTVTRQVAEALRDAIEPHAHIVSWRGDSQDQDTKNYRFGFDCDWWVSREQFLALAGNMAVGNLALSGDMTDGDDLLKV